MGRLRDYGMLVVGVVLTIVGALLWLTYDPEPPSSTTPAPVPPPSRVVYPDPPLGTMEPSSSGTVRPRQPERLRIWHYDAPVISIPLTGSELVPPPDPTVLGWWGRPSGAKHGATLLTGHTVSTGGGTFDDLEDIPVGIVGNLSGVKYRVAEVQVLSKTELSQRAPRLFRQDGTPRLVLVTCEGYDPATGHYEDNVVVTLRRK
jgi:hypothetical protein